MNTEHKGQANSQDRIIQHKPVITGTRMPVELVLAKLDQNPELDELFADYPRLTREDVKACSQYARKVEDDTAGEP